MIGNSCLALQRNGVSVKHIAFAPEFSWDVGNQHISCKDEYRGIKHIALLPLVSKVLNRDEFLQRRWEIFVQETSGHFIALTSGPDSCSN